MEASFFLSQNFFKWCKLTSVGAPSFYLILHTKTDSGSRKIWPEKSDSSQPMQSNTVSSVRPILAAKFSGANFVNLDGCLKYQIFLDISYIYNICPSTWGERHWVAQCMLDVSSACLHLHSYPLSLSLHSGISIYMETVTLNSIPILEMFLGG